MRLPDLAADSSLLAAENVETWAARPDVSGVGVHQRLELLAGAGTSSTAASIELRDNDDEHDRYHHDLYHHDLYHHDPYHHDDHADRSDRVDHIWACEWLDGGHQLCVFRLHLRRERIVVPVLLGWRWLCGVQLASVILESRERFAHVLGGSGQRRAHLQSSVGDLDGHGEQFERVCGAVHEHESVEHADTFDPEGGSEQRCDGCVVDDEHALSAARL